MWMMETDGGIGNKKCAITLKFDRTAPGSGAEALCRLENGRAFLEWRFHLVEYSEEEAAKITLPRDAAELGHGEEMTEQFIRLCLTDREGTPVLECIQFLREEEPLQSILPQPRLWNGISDPYLYKLEAVLADREGNCLDRIRSFLPLRQVECRSSEGKEETFLNGEFFEKRMVRYALPETGNPAKRQGTVLEDLKLLQKLGANCLLPDRSPGLPRCGGVWGGFSSSLPGDGAEQCASGPIMPSGYSMFRQLCDSLGFLVFSPENDSIEQEDSDIPAFRGIRNSFFLPGRKAPAPLYFQYRAKWSREPFVYLVPESLKRLDDGNYTVCCYSNCGKVALYTDGRLFEFKAGELAFVFYGIPCKKPTVMLTAEGEGCSHSLSIHKSFTKQSPFHDIFPLK